MFFFLACWRKGPSYGSCFQQLCLLKFVCNMNNPLCWKARRKLDGLDLDIIHAVRHCRSETVLIYSHIAFIYKVNGNKCNIIANIFIPCYFGFSLHATLAWLQTFLPVFLRPIYNCFRWGPFIHYVCKRSVWVGLENDHFC